MAHDKQELWETIVNQLSLNKVKLEIYRGTNLDIEHLPTKDGCLYFAYDTGRIFLDKAITDDLGNKQVKRYLMSSSSSGGTGSSGFIYTNADINAETLIKVNNLVDNIDDPRYYIYRAALPEDLLFLPDVDTLIINSNGWFFRVIEQDSLNDRIIANLISAGGSGGGSGSGETTDDLELTLGSGWGDGRTFIYGQSYELNVIGTATRDDTVQLSIYVKDEEHDIVVLDKTYAHPSGQAYKFNTNVLPESQNITIHFELNSANSRMYNAYKPKTTLSNIKVVEMGIAKSSSLTTTSGYFVGAQSLSFLVLGDSTDITVTPHMLIDGIETTVNLLPFTLQGATKSINIPQQEHGVHTVEIYLTTVLDGISLRTDSLSYELAWVDPNSDIPLIWFDDLPETVVNYDNCIIKYQVFNPATERQHATTLVNLMQEREPIPNSPIEISYNPNEWLQWDISSLYKINGIVDTVNNFSISCGAVRRDFDFIVTSVGARDLGLVNENSLILNLSSAGRSNSETGSVRSNWSYTDSTNQVTYATHFNNFNWFNNGWADDNSGNGSYLSIANGASATIDFKPIELNSTSSTTIEMRFRVRNIQEYSTLVTTVARYNVVEDSARAYTLDEIEANGYTLAYDEDGNPQMNESQSTKETISDKGVCFKYWDNSQYGFCIGTQEAFFKSRAGVANVRYKENEIINLAFVIAGGDNQHILYIYLNGILSGAIDLTKNSGIESIDALNFEINSKYCDFDLYRLRVYSTYLSMPEVIHNYLSDMRNVELYDQNQLTDPRDQTQLLYSKIVDYNKTIIEENAAITTRSGVSAYINQLTMPYATIQTIDNIADLGLRTTASGGTTDGVDDDRLPYYKGNSRYVKIEFVNPALDEALAKGIITEDYYYTHSPSYVVVGAEIDVQGTSSQGYPRRNYKTKMKSATKAAPTGWQETENYKWGWHYTKGSKAGKTFKKWNMDNPDCATNKFTWKIDYMESSGTYNTGFANLVGNNIYSKHPLEYYDFDGINAENYRTSVYGFPVLVFHKHSQQEDLEKYGTKNESSVYTYIGRYNLNLDKSANEYYGFESDAEQPYVDAPWDEETDELDEDGQPVVIHHEHPLIANVAECWELRDNQGTWTSFKYPDDAKESRFSTQDASDKLEVVKHFEYRYNADEDALDVCYDFKEDAANNAVKYSGGKVDLSTKTKMNNFLREKHKNLERFFNWLASTDTSNVPAQDNDPSATILSETEAARRFDETVNYMIETEEDSEQNITYTWLVNATGEHIYRLPTERDESGNLILNKDADGYLLNDDNERLDNCIAASNYTGTVRAFDVKVSYNTDCAGYRLHKFKEEFSKHLNLEYCIDYFILTELLLCYDSRGKNMMLASWGPMEQDGEYIWFPIFYDVDTQLGLNNIGAVLWDYNADATLDGDFSTANSVLWVNLWAAYRSTIESTYRSLRKANKLNEANIEGAYLCDPNVFKDSYAMKGVRPIVALGLDEYYKYILPGINSGSAYAETPWKAVRYGGFITTEGKWSTTNGYIYTCQGDRKLSRELLIRNRLNYLDSWWLAGDYIAEKVKSGIMIRANANDIHTSDKFLDQSLVSSNVDGYERVTYPLRYFDAVPQFKITPFLSQYVTVFYDEDPITPSQKYNGIDPVSTNTTPSVENGYRAIHPYNEQLTYIPGGDFVSSLGDLSLKYPSHFTLGTGTRLLDITLGSDIPGYNNSLLGKGEGTFDLNAGQNSANKKGLLQKIILTGVSGLSGIIDISTTEKLTEFRALGTNITGVSFASGSPLEIVHLPKTITGLTLVEAKNLTHTLTTTPVVMELASGNTNDHTAVYQYVNRDNYKGLFIDGITNYNSETDTDELKFLTLNISSDSLGYDSYRIMENMITKRIQTKTLLGMDKTIALTITGVNWCPYEVISSTEVPDPEVEYYVVTDHGTFESYHYTEDKLDEFIRLRRNEKLFILDDAKNAVKDTIQSPEYLDLFIEDHQNGNTSNTRYRADNSTAYEIPNIQGVLFIDNDSEHPIKETDLDKETGKYPRAFPNLTIYANYIEESYVSKFIQEDDVGKENEFALIRIDRESEDLAAPYPTEIPIKQNYDFKGWALDSQGNNIIIDYSEDTGLVPKSNYAEICSFSESQTIITFYAIFELHKYNMNFYNDNDNILITTKETFKTTAGIAEPSIVPASTKVDLALTEVYKWLGWAKKTNPSVVIDLATDVTPIMDIDFIAVYEKVSVYDNILDTKYLSFNTTSQTLSLNQNYKLSGKITLPAAIDNVPVLAIEGFWGDYDTKHTITHIFWEEENRALTTINASCFRDSNSLVYYEQPETCTTLYGQAFTGCRALGANDNSVLTQILEPVRYIKGANIFQNLGQNQNVKPTLILPGHDYNEIANTAFGNLGSISNLQIGSLTDPCDWFNMVGSVLTLNNGISSIGSTVGSGLQSLRIYITAANNTSANRTALLAVLGVNNSSGNTITDDMMAMNDVSANYAWIIVNSE